VHFVAAAEVFFFIPAAHTALAHVAMSVQQAVFRAASSAPDMPALRGSKYFPAAHVTVLPPHFVVSFSQHVLWTQEAAFDVHFVAAAAVFFFMPAAHTALAHVAKSVQQAAFRAASSAPPGMPALTASKYFPEAHVTVLPPHFVVSFSQHVLLEQEAAFDVHFVALAEAFFFIPVPHMASAHVAMSVQQAVFRAASSAPATAPALEESKYFPEAHVTVLPAHFVLSSQHDLQLVALFVALVHFKLVRVALSFHPSAHGSVALKTPTGITISKATIFLAFISSVPKL